MGFYLFVLFVSVPLIELWVIIRINAFIGLGGTIAVIFVTGLAGSWLARCQGRQAVRRIREELAAGRMPADKIIEGLLLLAGGFMLVFPGYITDFLGFMLLVPGNRRFLRELVKKRFRTQIQVVPEDE